MGIVARRHPQIGVPELRGDNRHGNARAREARLAAMKVNADNEARRAFEAAFGSGS